MAFSSSSTCSSSVPAPLHSACNNTLYYYSISTLLPAVEDLCCMPPGSAFGLPPGIRVVLQLTFLYCSRISEILNINSDDELRPSLFLVKGKKRSADYTVHIPIDGVNRTAISSSAVPFKLFPFTYMQVYRAALRSGLSIAVEGRRNLAVTHRSRYELARSVSELNKVTSLQDILRHRSPASQGFYLRGRFK
jgi:hypothetical protein